MNNEQNIERKNKLLIPKIDVVFHSLFRANKEELTSKFVSGIMQKEVKVIHMDKDRHLVRKYPEQKMGILDLRTELEGGTICNIEIQLANKANIIDRILYYWSRAFSEQLKEGEEYGKLNKTIVILIADFEIEEMKEIEEIGTRWVIMSEGDVRKVLTEKLEIRILEIPKAKKVQKSKKKNEIAQWLVFLDNPNSREVEEIMEENEEIKEVAEELEEISKDYELRRIAELKEKYIRDEKSEKIYAMEQGLKKGKKEGLEQGKKQIVKEMLKNKLDIELITKISGLSREEIEKIEKEIK